jgi:hypothetical protein
MQNYTPNEWRRRRRQTTLETGREDAKIHSKRVRKMSNSELRSYGVLEMENSHDKARILWKSYTRNEWGTRKTSLETSGELGKLHSKRVGNSENYTRNEWRTANPPILFCIIFFSKGFKETGNSQQFRKKDFERLVRIMGGFIHSF